MIFKNSVLLAFFSVLSLLLAIVRDRLLAMYVGVGPALDVYNASFRIPDLMYGALLAFVTSGTVVPYLTKETRTGHLADPRAKLASLTLFFVGIIGVLAAVIAITLPLFAHIIVPGFTEEQLVLFITTTRILLIQPIVLGVTSLISCFAQLKNHFLLYGLSPLGYSLGIICGIMFFYEPYGVMGLVYGVLLGAVVSFSIQAASLRGVSFSYAFKHMSWSHIRDLTRFALPRTGTNITTQVRVVFFHAIATTLGAGVLSAYLFAQKITDAVVQVIQQSITTASMPVLSKDIVEQKVEVYISVVRKYVLLIGVLGVGASSVLYVLQDSVIYLLYGDTGSNNLIAFFLFGFLVALPFQMMTGFFAGSLYSAHDTKDVFMSHFISTFMAISIVLLTRNSGAYALVYGYISFWVINFLIILALYSRKKLT